MKSTLDSATKFVTDPKFIKILEAFDKDSKQRKLAEPDIRAYLISKGIKVPQNWEISFLNHSFELSGSGCTKKWNVTFCFKVTVTRENGKWSATASANAS